MPRTDRYAEILSQSDLMTPIHVVGCGAIGRQVTLQLAAMGFEELLLTDMDVVDDANLGTQGWPVASVGARKPEALARDVRSLFPGCEVETWVKRVQDLVPMQLDKPIVFMCVDDMDTRKDVHDALIDRGDLRRCRAAIDTRMGDQSGVVHPILYDDPESIRRWEESWFPQSEAEPMPCAARSTLYCASYAASLAVAQAVQILRGQPRLAKPVHFNLVASILTPLG